MKQLNPRKLPSRLLVHLIAWAIIFLLPYIFTSEYHVETNGDSIFIYLDTVTKIFWLLLFYLNVAVVIPRLLYTRKYVVFGVLQVLLFILIMVLHGQLFELMIAGRPFRFVRSTSHNILPFLFTVIASIAYKTISDKIRGDAEANERQKENLKTELSFLRSQISPHFLFNVLNNMVALVRLRSEELEPTILKLSSLMQYMLYETEEKVQLKTEVEYLQSYIDLQQQRFGQKLRVDVLYDLQEDWHNIEPMLLIPFVENAFKHGVGMVPCPAIEISMRTVGGQLQFTVRNKYSHTDTVKDKTSGIGLANVRRRLELLYANRHQLTVTQADGWFSVVLTLTLKP